MTYPSFNLPTDIPNVPEELDWRADLNHPENHFAHRFHPSTTVGASMFSATHLLYNDREQHPSTPQNPNILMPSAATHLNLHDLDLGTIRFLVEDTSTMRSLAEESISPRHNSTSTTILASTPTEEEPSQTNTNTKRRPQGKLPSDRVETRKPKKEEVRGSFHCYWKDCKYGRVFSRKGVLMRHIETQHVFPRSIDCPVCGRFFSRKDNMTEHLGRIHHKRI